jgi:Na+/proline symporter
VLCIFVFLVYTPSSVPQLGSPGLVWEHLTKLAETYPVEGNKGGSYLTMFSKGGFVFGIINIIGNFGTVFVDQGYWQSAIAARPSAAHTGYLMGGIMWFCIPFTLATTMGLSALALDLPITLAESGSGLVPPAAAVFLMGRPGAILMTTMLFMAVTSAGSAELVAVSSLCTYDIYRTYINPKATGARAPV